MKYMNVKHLKQLLSKVSPESKEAGAIRDLLNKHAEIKKIEIDMKNQESLFNINGLYKELVKP